MSYNCRMEKGSLTRRFVSLVGKAPFSGKHFVRWHYTNGLHAIANGSPALLKSSKRNILAFGLANAVIAASSTSWALPGLSDSMPVGLRAAETGYGALCVLGFGAAAAAQLILNRELEIGREHD